jgi:CheY-like chemotaxis protein
MAVVVEMQNTGNLANRSEIVASIEHTVSQDQLPSGRASLFSLTPSSLREENPAQIAIPFGRWSMYRPPPLRGQPVLEGKKVLLIDPNQTTRDVRVRVLQSHGVEVRAAASLRTARFLWRPNVYDLILLDMRRQLPGEAFDFCEEIRKASPREHFAFFVGPPVYLSRTWPSEVIDVGASQGQWGATVRRFLTAA